MAFPSNADMRGVGNDPHGFPVQVLVEKSIGTLAREMLLQPHLDSGITSAPQHRGMEMELFAPGDVGVVLRYRW